MRTRKTRFVPAAALMAAFVMAGCDDSPTVPPPDPVATDVEVSPGEVTLTFIGASAEFGATVLDETGSPISGAEVTWSSSDPEVASVATDGTVTAVANGSATITATSGDAQGSAGITVDQEPDAIEPDTSEVLLTAIGQSMQVEVTVVDEGGTPIDAAELEWSSSDEAVATVDAEGVIEAVGPGSAVITASAGELSAEIEVVVQPAAAVSLAPSGIEFASIGATTELTATVTDAEGGEIIGALLSWSSSDEAVATVDENGVVEAVANGEATITVEVLGIEGLSATAEVTVEQQAAGISVSPAEVTLTEAGATAELTATVFDAEGNEIEGAVVLWATSDAEVATVDEDGLVEAVASGEATITAMIGELSAEAEVTVDIED